MTYYVGIDIAKFKHDCFIADDNGCVVRDSFSFKNNKDGFEVLISILKELSSSKCVHVEKGEREEQIKSLS